MLNERSTLAQLPAYFISQFSLLLGKHLATITDLKLKQAPKIRKLQNRHYLPTFLPRFWPLGQTLNI